MSQIEVKTTAWPAGPNVTPSNPRQDSFMRLREAEQLRQQGKLDRAQRLCEALVRQCPDYMMALHTLGLVLADKQNYQQALNYLVRAAMLNPRSWTTLTALSGVYSCLGANEMAAQALEQAKAIKPQDTSILLTIGEIYRDQNEYELARDAYRQALALEANLVPAAMGLGWICSHMGQHAEAADAFEGLIKRGMRSIEVLHALTGLPAALVSIDLLTELDKVVCDQSADKARLENMAAFTRAAALDRAARHAQAWEHVEAANRTVFRSKQKELDAVAEGRRASLRSLREKPIKVARGSGGDGQAISLFILGPSRSGKTTMEWLVAALDGVKRGYENPIVQNAVRRTFHTAGLLPSSQLEDLPAQAYPQCRDIYLEELARRAGSARVFTNTNPTAVYEAARMAAAFPDVRFVFVKRNVEDVVLRIYMRHYDKGNAYAYDLKSARDHVMWYHQMMDLLAEKLPDIVRVIHYEDMVADPAAVLRVAADLCGLPMPEGALPPIGDDRGCAAPYRQFMAAGLER